MVAYQRGPGKEPAIADIEFSKRTIKVPEAVHKVIELDKPVVKQPPFHLSESDVDCLMDLDIDFELLIE